MKLLSAIIFSALISTTAFAQDKNEDKSKFDVKQGVEKVQYEWTKLPEKDKELLKESSDLEKNADSKVKSELSEYRAKSDELYKALSDDAKSFLSTKSKLHKKLSNKGKKILDEMYFLVRRGVTTFHIPGIDEVMPKVNVKHADNITDKPKNSDVTSKPSAPIVNGQPISDSKTTTEAKKY